MTHAPERRTAAFYFVLFLTGGVANAYLGVWLATRGLSDEQIGVVNAAPVFVTMLLTLLIGRLADRARDWRQVVLIGAVLSGVAGLALPLAQGFWAILAAWTAYSVLHMGIVPVIDAAAMRLTARRGTDFAALRGYGTAGYLFVLVGTGYAAAVWGDGAFVPLFLAACLIRAIVAFGLPAFRAPGDAVPGPGATRLRQVMQPWFLLPLVGFAIINATHHLQNAFQALIWDRQGIGPELIGILIAVGALSETIVFFAFQRVGARFRARTLLMFSAALTVVRWAAMAFAPGLFWLFILQSMHGLTYAIGFLAIIRFIANWTAEDIAAEAQGFFVTLHQIASVIAITGFGWLLARVGDLAFLSAAALAVVALGMIWASRVVQGPAPLADPRGSTVAIVAQTDGATNATPGVFQRR